MVTKVVVVGVNHAGTSFIRTLATINSKIKINAYDKNSDISFLGCGIALWVGGEFKDPNGLFYSSKEKLENIYKAKVKMEHEVIEINSKQKFVVVKDLKTGKTFKDKFDKLVYAGGTWPIKLPVENADLKNIYFSKLFAHAKKIKTACNSKKTKNVVIIGAGYIGIELVEAFHKAGKKVTLIDMANRVIPRYFDPEFTDPLMKTMKKNGVKLAMGEKTTGFVGDKKGNVTHVVTDSGKYKVDIVISAIGFKPVTELLKGQVSMLPNGAIKVNQFQQSSKKDIYAIGDSAAIKHHQLKTAHVALATNAVKTGIVAAMHVAGNINLKFPGVNGTNAISVFDYNYSSTGLSEETCKLFKIKHAASFLIDKDKPEFMHDATDVLFKIVYDPETLKLLGAQVGSKKVNHTEVIYAFSLALSKGLTLLDLVLMDVFFLPHFNKPFNFMLRSIMLALGLDYKTFEGKKTSKKRIIKKVVKSTKKF